jgi:5-methylcytosine-specific restriction protein A
MTHNWDSSRRPKDPPHWKQLRAHTIARAGGLCQASPPCTYPGTQVDHILNVLSGGTHDLNNLQLLCDWHHKQKTAQEAAKARAAKPRHTERRKPEQHPGLLT